jgi:hypothetical protein
MVGCDSEVDEVSKSRAIRFASWMIPLTASMAPEPVPGKGAVTVYARVL